MRSKDIVGKTVAKIDQTTQYSTHFGKNRNEVTVIWFTDGSRVVLRSIPDDFEDFCTLDYYPRERHASV